MSDWLVQHESTAISTDLRKRLTAITRVADLRRDGLTLEQIAEHIRLGADGEEPYNISVGAVAKIWREYSQKRAEELHEDEAVARQVTLDRLDAIIAGLLPEARAGDTAAARVVLQAERDRAALLGLNAAQRVEHTHTGDVRVSLGIDPEEIRREQEATIAAFGPVDGTAEEIQGG